MRYITGVTTTTTNQRNASRSERERKVKLDHTGILYETTAANRNLPPPRDEERAERSITFNMRQSREQD
jgi:hypothetical protein